MNKVMRDANLARGAALGTAVRHALRTSTGVFAVGVTLAIAPGTSAAASALAALVMERAAEAGDGTTGFVLQGIAASENSGRSVSNAGDINGDGIDDLLIGAPYTTPDSDRREAGASYVVFGRTTGFPSGFELRTLLPADGGDGSEGFALMGVEKDDLAGYSLSDAGDVNGDGMDDLLIGSKEYAGEAFVVFGRTTAFPAVFELRSLYPGDGGDGSTGFVLQGYDTDSAGRAVSGAGDVNGDGLADLLIGAPSAGQRHEGAGYVVFGRSTFPPVFHLRSLYPAGGGDGSAGLVLRGISDYDRSGERVSAAGDVNGDGIDDLMIGAPDALGFGTGEVFVVFGRANGFPATFELRSLLPVAGGDGSTGFMMKGIEETDSLGSSLSDAGDVNGDGIDDLIIAAYGSSPRDRNNAGTSYVVFGRATGFPARFDLRELFPGAGGDGSAGFVLLGIDEDDAFPGGVGGGLAVSGAGDIDGDGVADLLVGASGGDPQGRSNAGESYIVFGRTTAFPAAFELRSLLPGGGGDGSTGFVLRGVSEGSWSGFAVSEAGDVNGDGVDDILIGAPKTLRAPGPSVGQGYVVFGRETGFPAIFDLWTLLPSP